MKKMGFDQVDEQTVQNVLREVDADNDGQVSVGFRYVTWHSTCPFFADQTHPTV